MDEIVGVCMSDKSSLIVSWNGSNDSFKNFEQAFTNKEKGVLCAGASEYYLVKMNKADRSFCVHFGFKGTRMTHTI